MPSSDLYGPYEHKPLMPINDVNGNLVSLALRLGDSGHKYHYLPFSKMHHLFGLDKAQEYIIKEDMVYIVEGFFDVLLPVSNGVRNVVAIMGTRISKEQVYLLASFTNNFTFVLDSDGAGMRSIPLVTKLIQELAPDVTCHTMFTYPYKDFADYCTGGGLCRNQNLTKNQNL
jgi:DNA primase